MLWIIERILERLFLRSALEMGSRKEAEMELEQVESRAKLLRRAKELEEEKIPGFEQLAATLRKRAADMEPGAVSPGSDMLKIAQELQAGDFENGNEKKTPRLGASQKRPQTALPAPTGKKRGRPRKRPLPDSTGPQNAAS